MSVSVRKEREKERVMRMVEGRICPWCRKFVTPQRDKEGDLYCPECGNYIVFHDGTPVITQEASSQSSQQTEQAQQKADSEEDIIPASELGVDDELEVVSVEEAAQRCPFIIEQWEWRQSQFTDSQGRREFASMECRDKEQRRFVWNTSARQPCRKLKIAEQKGYKRILVREITYNMRDGRPVNIRIR